MSFIAVIDRPKNIATWCRSCVSLAGISPQIQFLITNSLAIQAVNSSRTTHAEVTFDNSFFREMSLDSAENCAFVVSSKHLIMLFRNLEPKDLNYICLRVDTSDGLPVQRQYKLNVETNSKKLVLKKYQVSFQPVLEEEVSNLERYNEILQRSKHNQFVLETTVMKQFFDMVPIQTEDFGIEIKLTKINFSAYTKLVTKDREYIKHPMLIMILMATEELPETNLGDVEMELHFRLKDFRNFISLISNLKSESQYDVETIEPEPTFEAVFKEPSNPILFQHVRPHFSVRFLQITALGTSRTDEPFVLNLPKLQSHAEEPKTGSKRRREEPEYPASNMLLDGDTDYTNSEDELGPTQNVEKPKSLFD